MVEAGSTPIDALRYGTSSAAELLGLSGEIGTLEPGKRADILAVNGNPLQDIRAVHGVRLVLRNGVEAYATRAGE